MRLHEILARFLWAWGRALGLAILDGDHALYKVGKRLEERSMVSLLQPGLTRASLHDYRLGHILDALCAANLNRVFGAIALKALEVYAPPTPWLHQDTTTIALYGAYEDQPGGYPSVSRLGGACATASSIWTQ